MTKNINYFKRKELEIRLFNRKYNIPNYDLKSILEDKFINYLNYKNKNMAITNKFSNTNKNHQVLEYGNFKVKYEYQRYDIRFTYDSFLKNFYGIEAQNNKLFFTNSGMAALYATFKSLEKLKFKLEILGNIYVETERLVDDYMIKFKSTKTYLFVDTTNFNDILEELKTKDLSRYEVFVIDTTDYLRDDLKPIISFLESYNKCIILIRSHLKLDMLGLEWATLGSICLISKNNNDLINTISEEIKVYLSLLGGFAYPINIPTFWNRKNFFRLTVDRTENIKRNAQYLYDKLESTFGKDRLILPKHKLFVIYKLNKEIDYKLINSYIDEFILPCNNELEIYSSDSFGFDYFAVNLYFINMSAYPSVRFSVGDVPSDQCVKITHQIENFIHRLQSLECGINK